MSQLGEASASAVIEPEIIEDKTIERIKVRLSVFFDGTKNNRTNTDLINQLRQEAEDSGQQRKDTQLFKHAKNGSSYANDYTNVAKMERYIETSSDKTYQKKMAIYIEGPGTKDKQSDKLFGYAFGMGKTGISKKVQKGIENSIKKIMDNKDKKTIIEKLTLDVFGFSRGAAAARYFIHQSRLSDENIKIGLDNKGCLLERIDVNFAGLYDTVSSHGISYSNDTSELKLYSIVHAENVIQLAAADEHRERFSLTNIRSARNGREIFLPGVHSDIGGSYNDGEVEQQIIYDSFDIEEAKQDRQNLIDAGWFKPEEIELIETVDYDDIGSTVQLKINRTVKYNHYSRIPLHIMTKYARESEIDILSQLEDDESISDKLSSVFENIKKYIDKHEDSKAGDWHHNDPWLCELRGQYLHFSARCEMGLWPRMEKAERFRNQSDG